MTVLNRTLVTVILALVAGLVLERWELQAQGRRRRADETDSRTLRDETQRWQREAAEAREQLAETEQNLRRADTLAKAADTDGTDVSGWLQRVAGLKEWLRRNPTQQIPELRYLTSNDWLSATLDNPLATEAQRRTALMKLRGLAKAKPEIGQNLTNALQRFARDHDGKPPMDTAELRSYLSPALSDDILARYETVPEIPGVNDQDGVNRPDAHFRGAGRIVLEESNPADPDYDSRTLYLMQGTAWIGVSRIGDAVNQAQAAFAKANPGQRVATPDQLIPYFTSSVDPQALREYWEVKDWH